MSDIQNLPKELCEPEGLLGEFARYLDETAEYSCPELFLAAGLSLLSVITGRKVQDYRGTRTNLMCVSIGETGCGKEYARKVLKRILKNTPLEGPEKFTSESALVTALETSPALLCQMDEMGQFLKACCGDKAPSHQMTLISGIMTAYTSSDSYWRPTGFARGDMTRGIEQPHFVLHGTTTLEQFFGALNGAHVASGFIGRLSLFLSPGGGGYAPMQKYELKPIPDKIQNFVQTWLDIQYPGLLNSHFSEPPVMPITTDAMERLKEHFFQISHRRIGEESTTASLWSRTSEKTSKLAMLHAISTGSSTIEIQSADWAVAVSNFLTRRLISLVVGNVADSEHHRKVQKLLNAVTKQGIVSQNELCRKTQWLSRKDRSEITQQLVESGLMFEIFRDSKTKPALGFVADIELLDGTSWKPLTPEIRTKIRTGDPSICSLE